MGLLLAVCAAGLVWHQDLTQIFVARQVEDNREEAAQDTGRLISHRGMCDVAPENSLPAFRLAGEWGYWGVECDISVTKDGHWVVMHDGTVNRMTNGKGKVSSFTLEQIRALRIDTGANVRHYTDLQVPTLEEFLEICQEYEMTPVIELKGAAADADYDALLSLLRQYDMEQQAVLLCFDFTKLQLLREKSPVHLMLLMKNPTNATVDLVAGLESCDLGLDYRNCRLSLVRYAKEKQILLNVYTVNDALVERDLARRGVTFITTDLLRPDPAQ